MRVALLFIKNIILISSTYVYIEGHQLKQPTELCSPLLHQSFCLILARIRDSNGNMGCMVSTPQFDKVECEQGMMIQ